MTITRALRVALVHGRAAPEHDGVADYVGRLAAALSHTGVAVSSTAVGGSGAELIRAARRLRTARPDLVHVQFAPSAMGFSPLPGLLPLLLPATTPVLTTVHEYGGWAAPAWVPQACWRVLERHRLWDRETARLVPASTAVLTTNPEHSDVVLRRWGVPAVRIPLAPNVADLVDHPRPATTRARFGVPADATVLVFFGFVHPVKGLRYLVEALAALRPEHPRLHLLVVGGFTSRALPPRQAAAFRDELGEWVRHCGVTDAVTVTGYLPAAQVSELLHAAELAVFPFTAGATTKSGALLSAFAHRLPTVVTAADLPDPDLVDGRTVVVAAGRRDAGALAAALRRALGDGALRSRVAGGGAGVAAQRTWARIAAAHREVYDQVVATPATHRGS